MNVTIGHRGDGAIVAHKAGCRDIARTVHHTWRVDAVTFEDVANDAYADQIAGQECTLKDAVDDIVFYPCTNGLTHAAQTAQVVPELVRTHDGWNVEINGQVVVGFITDEDPVVAVYGADGDAVFVAPLAELGVTI